VACSWLGRGGSDLEEPTRRVVRTSRAWLIIGVISAVLILGDLNRRMANDRRLERDSRDPTTEVAQLEQEDSDLQTQVAGATSDAMMEEWAHGEGARCVRASD
jgi:hypothetical protein